MRLAELRQKQGLSQKSLASLIGYSQNMISQWENGTRDPNTKTLQELANFFNVSIDYLLGNDIDVTKLSNYVELLPENKKIPIIGSVKCGPNGLAFEYLEGYILVGENYTGDIIAFRCRGDSMKDMGIGDGDIAIVRKQEDVECGELAVVVINGDEGTLKRVRKFDSGIVLEAANPDYPPRIFTGENLQLIHIVGKVLEVRKKF